jgi:hypothetical protein
MRPTRLGAGRARVRAVPGIIVILALLFIATFATASAASPPSVDGISPTSGSTSGGTVITITGHGFAGATSVAFGAGSAVPDVINDQTLTVVAPAHDAGLVHLRVTTPAGTSASTPADNFTYLEGPTVTGITPLSGPTSGGTEITIAGAGFTGATNVAFGAKSAVPDVVNDSLIRVTSPSHAAGVVHLRVSGPSGTSPATAADNFLYQDPPVVTGISPTSGSTAGGTVITISGSGFTGATSVSFGAVSVAPSVVSDDTIVVTSPAHAAGIVHLRVTTPGGQSASTSADNFLYTEGPVVEGISPTSGSTAGGTTITISGYGFANATSVSFGVQSVTPTVLSDDVITVISPPGPAGVVHLRVTTPSGVSPATAADNFTYISAPVVSSVTPNSGSTAGGTVVTIRGAGLTGATAVSFGDKSVQPTVVSDGQIVVTSPSNPPGVVHLRVTTPIGTSAETANDNFTYVASPTVTGISPSSGPITGGTVVTITGSGLTGTMSVSFGSVSVTPISVADASVVVVSPARDTVGVVHLRVTTNAGTSPATSADDFTYTSAASITYTLNYRWTLLVWQGKDGISVVDALKGRESPDNPATNDIYARVTAIYRWNAVGQRWEGNFPGSESVPGANDFTTLSKGTVYWLAIRSPGPVTWQVQP